MRPRAKSSTFEFRRPEIAEILGCTERSITNFVRDHGMPHVDGHLYDIRDVHTWAVHREARATRGAIALCLRELGAAVARGEIA